MGRPRFRFAPAALALLLAAAAACTRQPPPHAELPPPQVTVSHPVRRTLPDASEFTGRLEAVEKYEVRARVKGFLQSIKFREGDDVKKGDLLYEIDPCTFEAALASAQGAAAQLSAQVYQTQTERDRSARLRGTSAVSEEEYIQKDAAFRMAEAALKKAKADAEAARLELGFTKIYAPIDGVIGRTAVTRGNLVGYNEPTLLTTVVKIDPVYVVFDVPERDVQEYDRRVRAGLATPRDAGVPVSVGLVTDKGFPHEGVLDFRDNQVDAGTGTLRVRGVLPNPKRVLTPGQFCRVQVRTGPPRERLFVPEDALGSDQRGPYLLVVNANNTVEDRVVKTGVATDDGFVEVVGVLRPTAQGPVLTPGGLKPDEWVVVNGLQRARPGAKVDPQRLEAAAPGAAAK
jgi:RND family efflux transporter MFP subunit